MGEEKRRKWWRVGEQIKDLLPSHGVMGSVFFFGGDGTGLTPCIQPVPFLEFLFCSFRRRAEKWPCQGAALGCHTLELRPELGAGEGGARSSLPPPGGWADGGCSVARIASVFLFALFLFVTVALS